MACFFLQRGLFKGADYFVQGRVLKSVRKGIKGFFSFKDVFVHYGLFKGAFGEASMPHSPLQDSAHTHKVLPA
jgi:hypothetical protein